MSNIKALDKLRESSHLDDSKWTLENGDVVIMFGRAPDDPNAVNWGEQWREISDAIESEVAERFIELPCDAEGVPWHVGDVTENGNVVKAITFDRIGAHFTGTVNDIDPSIHTHSKPRTVEDVLREFAERYLDYEGMPSAGRRGVSEALMDEYAAEIRELTRGEGMSTLTAEQVREAWCSNLKRDCLYDPPSPDWQAIADELNTRAELTCNLIEDGASLHCSNCGGEAEKQSWAYWSYCPNCAAKVIA